MIDLATIGIGMDTSGLLKGTAALKENERQAGRTADAADKTGAAAKRAGDGFSSLGNAIKGLAIGFVIKEFIQAADAMSTLDARLKLASGSLAEFGKIQSEVYRISQQNSIGLQETAALYTRLAAPIKRLGGGINEIVGVTNTFQKALQLGGVSAQEAASATLQFGQALGKGSLSGDEFNSIAEASPRILQAIAEGANLPIEKLKQLGSEGKLSAEVVGNALLAVKKQVEKEFATLPDTASKAGTRFKNDILKAIGEINSTSGFTLGLAGVIEEARSLIPVIKEELTGAFQAVQGWIDRNRVELRAVFEDSKALVGQVYELASAGGRVVGAIAEMALGAGNALSLITGIQFAVAGIQDGVTFLGAAFATVGSIILKTVLAPVGLFLDGIAKVQGLLGNTASAAAYSKAAAGVKEFAAAGAQYGDAVVQAFGRGDSAVGRLRASLDDSTKVAGEAGKAAAAAEEPIKKLKGATEESGKAAKKAAEEYKKLIDRLKGGLSDALAEAEAAQNGYNKSQQEFVAFARSDVFAKLSDARKREVTSLYEQKIAVEQTADAYKEFIKAIDESDAARLKGLTAGDESIEKLEEQNKALRDEIELIGLSERQQIAVIQARNEGTIALKEELLARRQKLDIGREENEQLALEIKALRERNELLGKKLDRSEAAQTYEGLRAEGKRFYEDLERGLTDSLFRAFEAGKGFFSTLWDGIKNLFKTTVLKLAIQGVVTSVLGGSGLAQAGQAVGGLGGIGGLLGELGSAFGSSFGAGVQSTLFGGLEIFNISLEGGMAAIAEGTTTAIASGLGQIAGTIAPYAAAALAAYKIIDSLFGSKGGPKTESTYDTGYSSLNRAGSDPTTARELSDSIEAAYQQLATSLGLAVQDLQVGVFTAIDHAGDALTQLQVVARQNGQEIYNRGARLGGDGTGATPGGIENVGRSEAELQAAIAAEMQQVLLAALQQSDLAQRYKDYLNAATDLNAAATTVAQVRQLDIALRNIGGPLANLTQLTVAAELEAVNQLGGVQALDSYYQNFYTQAERNAATTARLTEEFTALGKEMPTTRLGLRQMIDAELELGEAGITTAARLISLETAFASVVPAADAAADAIGGTVATLQSVYGQFDSLADRFLTDSELRYYRVARIQQQLAAGGVNLTTEQISNTDVVGFRSLLADALNAGTQDGLNTASVLLSVADAFLELQPAAEQSLDSLRDYGRGLLDYVRGLRTGSMSPLSAQQRMGEASRQYQDTLAAARGGDAAARQRLQGVTDTFLGLAREYSPGGFGQVFNTVQADLSAFGNSLVNTAQTELEALQNLPAGIAEALAPLINGAGSRPGDIDAAYRAALGRPADAAGAAYYLQSGRTVAQIRQELSTSPEGQIAAAYRQQLGRDPDADGLAFYLAELQGGRKSMDQITKDLAYAKVHGSHADGLDRVPFDGYVMQAHVDEKLLSADNARRLDTLLDMAPVLGKFQSRGNDDALRPLVQELKALRQEVAQLRQQNNQGHAINAQATADNTKTVAGTIKETASRSAMQGRIAQRAVPT